MIILSDWDYETQTDENIKLKIRNLNVGAIGRNTHYSYTDWFYQLKNKGKNDE